MSRRPSLLGYVPEIVRLHREEGLGSSEIARRYDTTKQAITNILTGHRYAYITGIERKPNQAPKWTPEELEDIAERIHAGVPFDELAEIYGVTQPLISKLWKRIKSRDA